MRPGVGRGRLIRTRGARGQRGRREELSAHVHVGADAVTNVAVIRISARASEACLPAKVCQWRKWRKGAGVACSAAATYPATPSTPAPCLLILPTAYLPACLRSTAFAMYHEHLEGSLHANMLCSRMAPTHLACHWSPPSPPVNSVGCPPSIHHECSWSFRQDRANAKELLHVSPNVSFELYNSIYLSLDCLPLIAGTPGLCLSVASITSLIFSEHPPSVQSHSTELPYNIQQDQSILEHSILTAR